MFAPAFVVIGTLLFLLVSLAALGAVLYAVYKLAIE